MCARVTATTLLAIMLFFPSLPLVCAEPVTLEIGEVSLPWPWPGGAAFSQDGKYVVVGVSEQGEKGKEFRLSVIRTADGEPVRETTWPKWPHDPAQVRHSAHGVRGGREWSHLQSGELLTLASDGWGYLLWDVDSLVDPTREPKSRWLFGRDFYAQRPHQDGEPKRKAPEVVSQWDESSVVMRQVIETTDRRKPTEKTTLLSRYDLEAGEEVGQSLELETGKVWQFAAEAEDGVLEAVLCTTEGYRLWQIRWDDYRGQARECDRVVPGGYGPQLRNALWYVRSPKSHDLVFHRRSSRGNSTILRVYPFPTKGSIPHGDYGSWTPDERYVVLGDHRSLLRGHRRPLVLDLVDTESGQIVERRYAGTARMIVPLAFHSETLDVVTLSYSQSQPRLQIWRFGNHVR